MTTTDAAGKTHGFTWVTPVLCVDDATLDDRETMHEEYVVSGATIVQPPTDEPWGQREMVVEDLDRNTFRIGVVIG